MSSIEIGGAYKFVKLIKKYMPEYEHFLIGRSGSLIDEASNVFGKEKVFLLSGNTVIDALKIRKALSILSPDVIHLHGRGAGIYGRLFLPKEMHQKVVYTIHGFNYETLSLLTRYIYFLAERGLKKKVFIYHFVSESEKKLFLSKIGDCQRTVVIPNCIENIDGSTKRNELDVLDKYSLTHRIDLTRFFFAGRLSKQKGLDILLKALKIVRNRIKLKVVLDIYGSGPEEIRLKRLAKELGLDDTVHFCGSKKFDDINHNLYAALIVPSRFEGMPFIVLEAGQKCIPLIVTPSRGTTDIILDENFAYISKEISEKRLADAILTFINDLESRPINIVMRVANLYKRIISNFDCKLTINRLKWIYEKISTFKIVE
jgi:glycosyltransferase involved in cell wall biosynthesis